MPSPLAREFTVAELFSPHPLKAGPRSAGAKGRGVFALCDIAEGELIDAACTVELDETACGLVERTPLGAHYFHHPGDAARGLQVLGLASLCNHAEDHNAQTRYLYDSGLGWIVYLTARRPIRAGEEITRKYACPPWFHAA